MSQTFVESTPNDIKQSIAGKLIGKGVVSDGLTLQRIEFVSTYALKDLKTQDEKNEKEKTRNLCCF